jgi:hypothetical protein
MNIPLANINIEEILAKKGLHSYIPGIDVNVLEKIIGRNLKIFEES